MSRSVENGLRSASLADQHFREYEQLVSAWIDGFLEEQKSKIVSRPLNDKSKPTEATAQVEACE